MPILLGYTIPDGDEVTEYFDVVVETSYMPFADWRRSFLLAWAAQCFHCLNITQLIAIFCWYEYGIPYHRFYEELLEFMAARPQSLLGRYYAQVTSVINDAVDNTVSMGRPVPGYGEMVWYPEEASFLGMMTQKDELYADICQYLADLASRHELEMPTALQESLVAYQSATLVDPFSPREIRLELDHDFPAYFGRAYYGTPAKIASRHVSVMLYTDREYHGDLAAYAVGAVRFGRKNNGLRRKARRL